MSDRTDRLIYFYMSDQAEMVRTIHVDEVGELPRLFLVNLNYLDEKILILKTSPEDTKILYLYGRVYCDTLQ